MGAVERRHYGVASGLVGTMRTFGQMLSMGMVMILFSITMGQAQITPEHYPGFLIAVRTAFAISAVLCSAGRGGVSDARQERAGTPRGRASRDPSRRS